MSKENIIHHIDALLAEILPGVIPAPEFWRPPNEHEDVVELREIDKILAGSSEKLSNALKLVLTKKTGELVKKVNKHLTTGLPGLLAAVEKDSLGREYSDLLARSLFETLQDAHKSLKIPGADLPKELLKIWAKEVSLLWTQKAETQMKFEIIGFALDQYLKTLQTGGGEQK